MAAQRSAAPALDFFFFFFLQALFFLFLSLGDDDCQPCFDWACPVRNKIIANIIYLFVVEAPLVTGPATLL